MTHEGLNNMTALATAATGIAILIMVGVACYLIQEAFMTAILALGK